MFAEKYNFIRYVDYKAVIRVSKKNIKDLFLDRLIKEVSGIFHDDLTNQTEH